MRLLIAGASGALGRRLVPLLVARGHEVTGLTRSPEKVALVEGLGASATGAGVKRLVVESLATWYAPFGSAHGKPGNETQRDEQSPLWVDAPDPVGTAVRALIEMERVAQEAPFSTIILRYGGFYGPGTWLGRGGFIFEDTLKRKYPLLGNGAGY